jgi:sulfate transport system permease protein
MPLKQRSILPGFGVAMGFTLVYLSVIVFLPLAALCLKTATLSWGQFWGIVTAPRVVASYRLSFGASLAAALLNAVFGLLLAWVLVRYTFPGKRLVDALVDLPFALPTAVAGISLTSLFVKTGWIGQWLEPWGMQVAFTPLGVTTALLFIGFPFVVRTVQPVLEEVQVECEEAAASLGATRCRPFVASCCPRCFPPCSPGLPWRLPGP